MEEGEYYQPVGRPLFVEEAAALFTDLINVNALEVACGFYPSCLF